VRAYLFLEVRQWHLSRFCTLHSPSRQGPNSRRSLFSHVLHLDPSSSLQLIIDAPIKTLSPCTYPRTGSWGLLRILQGQCLFSNYRVAFAFSGRLGRFPGPRPIPYDDFLSVLFCLFSYKHSFYSGQAESEAVGDPVSRVACTSNTMSSLRDIMDVDVEPLESQAMRSRQAAQQHNDLDPSRSPISHAQKHDTREPQQVTRRRSHRVSKSTSQGTSSKPILSRRQSSVTAESMESDSYPQQGSSQMANAAGVSRQASRSSNPPESVRYTPVTGRVSRAKKGQPVHVCEQCDPPRVG
jgi:hypothetical protein